MSEQLSRRTLLRVAAGGALVAAAGATTGAARVPSAVSELDEKIQAAMAAYHIPGVAMGLLYRGREYVRGYGVTSIDDPQPVDGDTVFRVASNTKTFTGTAVMRLVERGRVDLDRTIRSYLPGFTTQDPAAAARATVRQALNHSAGWLGDYLLDTGTDDQALARYVAGMADVPQLTRPGTVFGYNNAALNVAGRVIEAVTGDTYEDALRRLVLAPLGLSGSAFTTAEIPGARIAVPHVFNPAGELVADPASFYVPRSLNPCGGLISGAHDLLRWARFHLGDGRPLLSSRSLHLMQSHPGPGGTLFVELDGVGVSWMIRPTAEGPKVIQHGGDWAGQHSGFMMVPERGFALTVLTNSDTGPALTGELFSDDWALSRFAGVHNLPATPRALPDDELAAYEGTYTAHEIYFDGELLSGSLDLVADAGQLSVRVDGAEYYRLAFYRHDYALVLGPGGEDSHVRMNFVRAKGEVAWLRFGGRLYRRGAVSTLGATRSLPVPTPSTLPHP